MTFSVLSVEKENSKVESTDNLLEWIKTKVRRNKRQINRGVAADRVNRDLR